jgi:hypothetical protein
MTGLGETSQATRQEFLHGPHRALGSSNAARLEHFEIALPSIYRIILIPYRKGLAFLL